jgi:hypothetical protein
MIDRISPEENVPLTSDIGSGTVNSFEDGGVLSDVSGGSKSEGTDALSVRVELLEGRW